MIVREIIVTCSNANVARAALRSIGGDFERGFSRDAESRNLSSGTLAAGLVRDFARRADEGDWEGLDDAIRGADMPVLAGLRHILEHAAKLRTEDVPVWRMAPQPAVLWCSPVCA